MGDGLVLKSGTHNDLIQASGPYTHLMESQKLREGCGLSDTDNTFGDWNENMEKEACEDVPLGSKNTNNLLASDILQQKQQAAGQNEEDQHYGLPYLFKRMFLLVRNQWELCIMGVVFACCMYLTFLVYLFSDSHSSQ